MELHHNHFHSSTLLQFIQPQQQPPLSQQEKQQEKQQQRRTQEANSSHHRRHNLLLPTASTQQRRQHQQQSLSTTMDPMTATTTSSMATPPSPPSPRGSNNNKNNNNTDVSRNLRHRRSLHDHHHHRRRLHQLGQSSSGRLHRLQTSKSNNQEDRQHQQRPTSQVCDDNANSSGDSTTSSNSDSSSEKTQQRGTSYRSFVQDGMMFYEREQYDMALHSYLLALKSLSSSSSSSSHMMADTIIDDDQNDDRENGDDNSNKSQHDRPIIAHTMANIGSVYLKLGQYRESSEFLIAALHMIQRLQHHQNRHHQEQEQQQNRDDNDYRGMRRRSLLQGHDIDDNDDDLLHDVCGGLPQLVGILNNLGTIASLEHDYDASLKYYRAALHEARSCLLDDVITSWDEDDEDGDDNGEERHHRDPTHRRGVSERSIYTQSGGHAFSSKTNDSAKDVAKTLHNIGRVLILQQRWEPAMCILKESLRVEEELYCRQKKSKKSKNTKKNTPQDGKINRTIHVVDTLNLIGFVQYSTNALDEALITYAEVLSIVREHHGLLNEEVARSLMNVALVMERQGRLENARKSFETALEVLEDISADESQPHQEYQQHDHAIVMEMLINSLRRIDEAMELKAKHQNDGKSGKRVDVQNNYNYHYNSGDNIDRRTEQYDAREWDDVDGDHRSVEVYNSSFDGPIESREGFGDDMVADSRDDDEYSF